MADLLIRQALVLDPVTGKVQGPADVCTAGEAVARVGDEGKLPEGWSPAEIIDGRRCLLMPGFVNTHHHVAMSLLRGYADDIPLMAWLNEHIWPVEQAMDDDDVYWGSLLGIAEMIAGGTVCFADMYFGMESVARAVAESGVRAVLSHGCVGLDAAAGARDLEATRRLIEGWDGAHGGRIRTMVAPHAPYTCPPGYLKQVLELAARYDQAVHIHLNETVDEVEQSLETYGCRPIRRMAREGLFDHRVLAAHVVHPDEEEMDLLAGGDVSVAHNPVSNLKLASGVAPVPELLAREIPVSLGTDGMASTNRTSMFTQMRAAAWIHKGVRRDASLLPAPSVLAMATWEGGRALNFWPGLGRLRPGAPADLVLVDLDAPHLAPLHDPVSSLVYAATDGDVAATVVGGRVLCQRGEFRTLDMERIMHEVQTRADRLSQRT